MLSGAICIKNMYDLNIVLLNYFTKADILTAVASVVADIHDCSYQVVITVTDNSENKENLREDLAARFPMVRYIDCGLNQGFGKGNTIGFLSTPARYYFALNRDTEIPEHSRTIERIIRFLDDHPEIGALGPKLVNMDGTLQHSCYRFDLMSLLVKPFRHLNWDGKLSVVKRHVDRLLMKDFDHNETRPVDWVLGAAIVVRAAAIEKVGWFDERYFMYMEDCDWCRTLWEHGFPVYYVHDIVIRHAHTRESSKVPGIVKALIKNKLARIHLLSWCKYMFKWRGTFRFYT